MHRRQPSHRRTSDRRGFSLIELLIVLVIIAILMSLLMVGIQAARTTARVVECTGEIKNLEKAIADFKAKFGVEPPSFIVLYERGTGGTAPNWGTDTTTMSTPALSQSARLASRAIIREMWPSFDFINNYDINGDGDTDDPDDVLVLNGAECLAFFIGGLQQPTDTNGDGTNDSVIARGFSANPATPFFGYTGNRIGPFFEGLNPVRFTDLDRDKVWEYRDPIPGQTNPYQYFSSYGGKGYRLNGLDGVAGNVDDETIVIGGTQTLRSVYNQAPGNTSTTTPAVPYKENGFQIISPGFDGDYGYGGYVHMENGVSSPTNAQDPAGRTGLLARERDNITNFKGQLN